MPIDIENPENIVVGSTPVLQEWSHTLSEVVLNYYQGADMPDPQVIHTVFKDVIGTAAAAGLTDFKYRAYVSVISAFPVCLVGSGYLWTGVVQQDYVNGQEGDFTYTYQNLNTLEPGFYQWRVHFQIVGKNASGAYQSITASEIKFNIRVFESTAPTIVPQAINFIMTVGAGIWLFEGFVINGESWLVRCPPGFAFLPVAGVDLEELPDGGVEALGEGEAIMALAANPSLEPEQITQNPLNFQLVINGGVMEIPITVTFIQESGLFLSKDTLNFIAYKGISEAGSQQVSCHYDGAYTLTGPAWATITPATGTNLSTQSISVISADNLEEGIYTGTITLKRNSDSTVIGTIDIIYEVVGKIKLPYVPGEPSFTLDKKFIELQSTMDDTYFNVLLSARLYEFYSNSYKDINVPLKVPLFERKQQFNIGLQIDRLMYAMADFIHHEGTQYRMATVNLQLTEKSRTDANYSQDYEISGLRFVAGLTPPLAFSNGFLDINPLPNRVTAAGYFYANMLVQGISALKIFKNGAAEPVDTIVFQAPTPGGGLTVGGGTSLGGAVPLGGGLVGTLLSSASIRSHKIDMAAYDAKQGDVFELKFYRKTSTGISKLLKVFPDGYESNFIVWENEYKLKSVMEFTGDYKVKSEFENRSQTLFLQLVDVLTKIESTKKCTLTINSGWLLKSDVPTLESLLRSKRAALVSEGRTINLVPVGKSLESVSSTQELYAFDVEFEINRDYNEEIYMF